METSPTISTDSMELIKACLFILISIYFVQSIHALDINHLVFSDKTSVLTYPCHNKQENDTTVQGICLYTCIKGDCHEDKYKIFSVEPKEVKDIHFYSATISNNKLLLAVVSNNTDAVHILKCGHASCTSFRSSYKPIADNSKSSIGYGVSINIQSNGNPIVSYFSKIEDNVVLNTVDCEDEYCDKYTIYNISETDSFQESYLSTHILNGTNTSIIIANDGFKVSSYHKVNDEYLETVLFDYPVERLTFKRSPNKDYFVSFVSNNHPHVGKCDANFKTCKTYTPPFLPGVSGSVDVVSKTDSQYSVVYASIMEFDEIVSSIQLASCKDTACSVVNIIYTEQHNISLPVRVSVSRNETTFPLVSFQYGARPLTLIDCFDETCLDYNQTSIDPTKTVSSRFQKRINITWAILILPSLCLVVAIILAVWRIQRYVRDKKDSYQPIS